MFKTVQKKLVKEPEWVKLNSLSQEFATCLQLSQEECTCVVISCDKNGKLNWNFMLGIGSSSACKTVKLCWVASGKRAVPGKSQWNSMLYEAVKTACPKANLLSIHSQVHTIPLMSQLGFLVCKRSLPLAQSPNVTSAINKVSAPVHPSPCRAGMDVSYMIMLQSILDSGLSPQSNKSISSLIENGISMYKQL